MGHPVQFRVASNAVSDTLQNFKEFQVEDFEEKISKLGIAQMGNLVEQVKKIYQAEVEALNQAQSAHLARFTLDFGKAIIRHVVLAAVWNGSIFVSRSSNLDGQLLWGSVAHKSGNWLNLGVFGGYLVRCSSEVSDLRERDRKSKELHKIATKMNLAIFNMGKSKWGFCVCKKCAPKHRKKCAS